MLMFSRRIPALLVSGAILVIAGAGAAAPRVQGGDVFRAIESVSYVVGSKRAIGYFQNVAGQCALTLMVAEAVDPDVQPDMGQVPTAARMRLAMTPGQTFILGSAEGESIVATCGARGETLEVKRNAVARY